MTEVTIRKLEGQEKLEAMYDLAVYAFSPTPPMPDKTEWFEKRKDRVLDRWWTVFEDGRPAAGVGYDNMPQNVRGSILPMGAVWGVSASPETRRKGYVRQCMTAALTAMRDEGMPVSCLYPFRESFYQRMGYTSWTYPHTAVFKLPALAPLFKMDFPGKVERLPLSEASDLYMDYLYEMRGRVHGMGFNEEDTRRARSDDQWILIVRENEQVTGLMLYKIENAGEDRWNKVFQGNRFYYKTPSARYQMLEWVARHTDQVSEARIHLAPFEYPETWLADMEVKLESDGRAPMGRVVDIAGLDGLLSKADGHFTAQISDPCCPWNEGIWRFESSGGCLNIERSSSPKADCMLTIQGLSAWVYGSLDPDSYWLLGWGKIPPETRDQMRTMLPLALPYLHEFF